MRIISLIFSSSFPGSCQDWGLFPTRSRDPLPADDVSERTNKSKPDAPNDFRQTIGWYWYGRSVWSERPQLHMRCFVASLQFHARIDAWPRSLVNQAREDEVGGRGREDEWRILTTGAARSSRWGQGLSFLFYIITRLVEQGQQKPPPF